MSALFLFKMPVFEKNAQGKFVPSKKQASISLINVVENLEEHNIHFKIEIPKNTVLPLLSMQRKFIEDFDTTVKIMQKNEKQGIKTLPETITSNVIQFFKKDDRTTQKSIDTFSRLTGQSSVFKGNVLFTHVVSTKDECPSKKSAHFLDLNFKKIPEGKFANTTLSYIDAGSVAFEDDLEFTSLVKTPTFVGETSVKSILKFQVVTSDK